MYPPIGTTELLLILVVVIVIFGLSKLPRLLENNVSMINTRDSQVIGTVGVGLKLTLEQDPCTLVLLQPLGHLSESSLDIKYWIDQLRCLSAPFCS